MTSFPFRTFTAISTVLQASLDNLFAQPEATPRLHAIRFSRPAPASENTQGVGR